MESEDSIMPTGTVVAILERAERFYVATFDVSTPLFSHSFISSFIV